MSTLVDVVGICETCRKGIILPMRIVESEGRGRTRRRFCSKDPCRKNRKKGRRKRVRR